MKKYTLQLIAISLITTAIMSLIVQDFSFLNPRWNAVIMDFKAWEFYSFN